MLRNTVQWLSLTADLWLRMSRTSPPACILHFSDGFQEKLIADETSTWKTILFGMSSRKTQFFIDTLHSTEH